MNVLINGESHSFDDEVLSLSDLLARLQLGQRTGLAVARNLCVVPRSQWDSEQVADGDEIEIVRATQGG